MLLILLKPILSKLWSSQLWTLFKQLRIEAWKSQDFNGVWTRDLAIPTELWSHWRWELVICEFYWACEVWMWSDIWNISYIDDHSLLDFKSAVQYMKYFIYHFKTNILKKPKINKPHPNQLQSSFLLHLSGM